MPDRTDILAVKLAVKVQHIIGRLLQQGRIAEALNFADACEGKHRNLAIQALGTFDIGGDTDEAAGQRAAMWAMAATFAAGALLVFDTPRWREMVRNSGAA